MAKLLYIQSRHLQDTISLIFFLHPICSLEIKLYYWFTKMATRWEVVSNFGWDKLTKRISHLAFFKMSGFFFFFWNICFWLVQQCSSFLQFGVMLSNSTYLTDSCITHRAASRLVPESWLSFANYSGLETVSCHYPSFPVNLNRCPAGPNCRALVANVPEIHPSTVFTTRH